MNEPTEPRRPPVRPTLSAQVDSKARRKLDARQHGVPGLWSGLGMMGQIGWSVAVPTLLGAGLGLWLDGHLSGTRSWTLALLVAGLVLGCLNAWRWVAKEEGSMHPKQPDAGDTDA
jgi:ATP synthase protein I